MADDAGFAVSLTIRQRLLNDAILVAYAGDSFPRTLKFRLPDGPPAASIDVFLGQPQISCKANNTLTITIQMWGSLTVTVNGLEETGEVAANLTLRLQPSFVVAGNNLVPKFDDVSQEVAATKWDFTVISGSGFSPDADSYLRGNSFRNRLQRAIQLAILLNQVQLPNIDIRFLGDGILAGANNTQSRVVDGALLFGIDVDTDDVTTAGDANQLADFAKNNDIAAATNAVAVPVLLQQVQSKVSDQVAQAGATLERLQITAQAGRFHVEGRAGNNFGSANFSFNVIPVLYGSRPGRFFGLRSAKSTVKVNPRVWPALGFTTADVEVDVDLSTWLQVVAVISVATGPAIPLFIFGMASEAAAHLDADITSANTGTPVPRVQYLKPSKPGGPTVRVEIAEYTITTLGTYVGITVQPKAPPGALIGLTSIPSNFRANSLSYSVRLPLGVPSDDPALRIRWTVIDTQGIVLVNEDDVAAGRETFTFVPDNVGPGMSQLSVGVRVYRTLGAQITDFVNDSIALVVRGSLPPGAYVRWYYSVTTPQVFFDDQSQTWEYRGEWSLRRHSNWHRTDRPCANVLPVRKDAHRTDVVNALPFPVRDIALHRSELCDYCFYGGPGGIRPSL